MESSGLEYYLMAGCCEYGTGLSVSIRRAEIVHQLCDWQRVKKDSIPCSQLSVSCRNGLARAGFALIHLFVNTEWKTLELPDGCCNTSTHLCVCVCVCVCVCASRDPSIVFYCSFSQIRCPPYNQDTLPFPYYKRVIVKYQISNT